MNYYDRKIELGEKAHKHTKEMEDKYGEEITEAINRTKIYDEDFGGFFTGNPDINIEVNTLDSVSAIFASESDEKMAVLNFASYKNPGGCFLGGSSAQEEALCHESFLYNVLREFDDTYYEWNRNHKNRALYLDRALYTPDVIFARDGREVKCDVITCAAPNYGAANKYCNVSLEYNNEALLKRIEFVLDIAAVNNVRTLILGAFGCGVFRQDAKIVAKIFKELLEIKTYPFKNVVFAVYSKYLDDYNYRSFAEVFNV